jgi:hypothetical protein
MAITIINSIESLIAPFLKREAISIVDIKSILLAGNVSFVTKDAILKQLLFSIESYCLMLIDLIEKRSNFQDKSDLLSLQHHKIIYCSIEILWQLGIKNFVQKYANFKLEDNMFPKSISTLEKHIEVFEILDTNLSATNIWHFTQCITKIVFNETFCSTMLSRNLDRILLSSFLFYCNFDNFIENNEMNVDSNKIKIETVQQLSYILNNDQLKQLVVNSLRTFTRGPSWIRIVAAKSVSKILQGTNGLEAVLKGYLEG